MKPLSFTEIEQIHGGKGIWESSLTFIFSAVGFASSLAITNSHLNIDKYKEGLTYLGKGIGKAIDSNFTYGETEINIGLETLTAFFGDIQFPQICFPPPPPHITSPSLL